MPEDFLKKATKTTIGGSIATGLVIWSASNINDPATKDMLMKASPAIGIAGDKAVNYLALKRKFIISGCLYFPQRIWRHYERNRKRRTAEEKLEKAQEFINNPHIPEEYRLQLKQDIAKTQRVVLDLIDHDMLNGKDQSIPSAAQSNNLIPIEESSSTNSADSTAEQAAPKPKKPRTPRDKRQ